MVALVRRLTGTRRVGHGGTLDPFATGVLPLFLGRATRLVEYHLGDAKHYRATVCFGASSTTDDLQGELTPASGPPPTRAAVEAALVQFRGRIDQLPPSYSAIKVGGRRAYAMARRGEQPEMRLRSVTITSLDLVEWDATDPDRPIAVVEVGCSAGTYVRALARDLGAALGSAAYLGALSRTTSGPFVLEDAVSLDRLRDVASGGTEAMASLLLPVDSGLDRFPVLALEPDEVTAIIRGQYVRPSRPFPADVEHLRLVDGADRLVAIASLKAGRLAPEKVLQDLPAPSGPTAGRRVVRGVERLAAEDGPLFVVVGVFDGLHRGHHYLLDRLREEAAARGAKATVITFDAHPDEILQGHAPPLLLDPDERLERLAGAGVDVSVVQHFDLALRMTPFGDFVAMITGRARLAGFLMTPDAAFGHERGGTPSSLAALGREQEFEVVVVPPFEVDGRQVRSADIRARIGEGDLAGAANLLGRSVSVAGTRALRAPGPADLVQLTFALPVALPPAGRYRVAVESAWRAGAERTPPIESTATLTAGQPGLALAEAGNLPDDNRLRVTFAERLDR